MTERKKVARTNPIPVRLDPEMREKLEEIARQRRIETGDNVTLSEVIREMFQLGLEDYRKEQEEKNRKDTEGDS